MKTIRRLVLPPIRLLGACVFLFLALAACSKLVALDEFWWQLVREHKFGTGAATIIAIGVPIAELVLAAMWLLGENRRLTTVLTVLLLGTFTAYLGMLYVRGHAPDCGCLGRIAAYMSWLEHTEVAIGRNTVMMTILLAWLGMATVEGTKDPEVELAP